MRPISFLVTVCIILIIALSLISCGQKGDTPEIAQQIDLSGLKNKYNTYLKLSREFQDEHGYILADECDSLLVTGLYGSAHNTVVPNIEAALDGNGGWHRRPLTYEECYPLHSKSSISRDMYTGLLWFIWKNKRLDLAEGIWEYGSKNNWIMGDGDVTRTFINPGFKATIAEIIFRLGGANRSDRHFPSQKFKNQGYEAHLSVLLIILNSELRGELDPEDKKILEYHVNRHPRNSLFQYALHKYTDGDYTKALETMMDEKYFPYDRLPARHDRLGDWLWARDFDNNWQPNTTLEHRVHTGGEFIFLASLIIKELE